MPVVARRSVIAEFRDAYYSELDPGEQGSRQGRVSVDVAVGSISVAGSVFAAMPVLRKVGRRLRERGHETETRPAGA